MNPQKTVSARNIQDMLVSIDAMVASAYEGRQPTHSRLSPSSILATIMFILIALALFQTYQRAMVTHDFIIIDDTAEMEEEM